MLDDRSEHAVRAGIVALIVEADTVCQRRLSGVILLPWPFYAREESDGLDGPARVAQRARDIDGLSGMAVEAATSSVVVNRNGASGLVRILENAEHSDRIQGEIDNEALIDPVELEP